MFKGKTGTSKHSRRVVKHQPLRIILLQLDAILNGTILEILANGRSDVHCRIKQSLLINDLRRNPIEDGAISGFSGQKSVPE